MTNQNLCVTLADVQRARELFDANQQTNPLIRTPCVRSGYFSAETGRNLYLKLDNLQHTGSFKERGALNRMLNLSPEERERGVIAASAGNHAQGVAYHARLLGISAKIVMPTTAPEIKQENTRRLGAEVVIEGKNYDESMEHTRKLAREEDRVLVHPFDDPHVIAGQGTIGMELLEDCPDLDAVVVSIGGGGLISGIAAAIKGLKPSVRIYGVESTARDAAFQSLEKGARARLTAEQMARETIADGIAVQEIGELTYPLISAHVEEVFTVEEAQIGTAIFQLLERQKIVVEGACAVTLAAVLDPAILSRIEGENVALLLSGGNIDVNLLWRIMEHCMTQSDRLAYLRVALKDTPGQLAGLTQLVGENRANILQLTQRHGVAGLGVREAEVDLTLETRGTDHVGAIKAALGAAGYEVIDEKEGTRWHGARGRA